MATNHAVPRFQISLPGDRTNKDLDNNSNQQTQNVNGDDDGPMGLGRYEDYETNIVKTMDDIAVKDMNPFTMPRDDEIFLVREREQRRELERKKELSSMKIWEKPSRHTTIASSAIMKQARGLSHSTVINRNVSNIKQNGSLFLNERMREKESAAEYIAKKREMFLVQMSLNVKREEIRKFEEKAQVKEDALRKSELMLEGDAVRFDKFLKDNDKSAHEAIRRHDEESKLKQEKVAEIKRLNQESAKIQSEISKYQEQLDDCLKYKEFIDKLTPHSERERIEELRRLNNDRDCDGEETMYFQRPQQLLEIFTALEERNLFLIQNSQETEESLEELKKKYEDTKKQMQAKTDALHANVNELTIKIQLENDKAARLDQRAHSNVGVVEQERMLEELGVKVTQVYGRCGFNPESNPDTLDKLAEIERKLESLITTMSTLPKEYVRAAEKKKEAERREQVRKEKVLEKKQAYEERLAKSVARATAAIPQRVGKKLMFRSPPLTRKKKKQSLEDKKKIEEELRFQKFFA